MPTTAQALHPGLALHKAPVSCDLCDQVCKLDGSEPGNEWAIGLF